MIQLFHSLPSPSSASLLQIRIDNVYGAVVLLSLNLTFHIVLQMFFCLLAATLYARSAFMSLVNVKICGGSGGIGTVQHWLWLCIVHWW